MSKTQSKIGITIPETPSQENYIYSAYFQYDSAEGFSWQEVYNNFPSSPTWAFSSTGIIETVTGFGYNFVSKNSVEILASRVPITGLVGASNDYHVSSGIVGGLSDDLKIELLDATFAPTNDFGAFYLRVTVYQ